MAAISLLNDRSRSGAHSMHQGTSRIREKRIQHFVHLSCQSSEDSPADYSLFSRRRSQLIGVAILIVYWDYIIVDEEN